MNNNEVLSKFNDITLHKHMCIAFAKMDDYLKEGPVDPTDGDIFKSYVELTNSQKIAIKKIEFDFDKYNCQIIKSIELHNKIKSLKFLCEHFSLLAEELEKD